MNRMVLQKIFGKSISKTWICSRQQSWTKHLHLERQASLGSSVHVSGSRTRGQRYRCRGVFLWCRYHCKTTARCLHEVQRPRQGHVPVTQREFLSQVSETCNTMESVCRHMDQYIYIYSMIRTGEHP